MGPLPGMRPSRPPSGTRCPSGSLQKTDGEGLANHPGAVSLSHEGGGLNRTPIRSLRPPRVPLVALERLASDRVHGIDRVDLPLARGLPGQELAELRDLRLPDRALLPAPVAVAEETVSGNRSGADERGEALYGSPPLTAR